ncbi:MAG TPA: hypothetical protein VG890_15495 [Puia sp.]|nr:hypothetical protein [Puia sp.]
MGYCKAMSQTTTCTKQDCDEIGANYSDDDPNSCLLLSALKDERAILMTSTLIYPTLIKFREVILRRTPLGRQFVEYFEEFYPEAKSIVLKDPQLVTDLVWLTTYVSPYLQSMLGEKPSTSPEGITAISLLASEFRTGTYKALTSIMHRFRKQGSKKFISALDESEKILGGFVGLSPEESLRKLNRRPAGAEETTGSNKKS